MTADKLAESYELGENCTDFFNYIIDSLINGQRQQVRKLFNEMQREDQNVFLNQFLIEDNSHQTEVKKICIEELTK